MFVPSIMRRNIFDDFFDFGDFDRSAKLMKTDIKEHDGGYELQIDLPGADKKDVTVELKDGYLNVTAVANRSNDEKDESGSYIRRERYSGSFARSFYVGEELTEEDIKARFENGVLTLAIPKKEAKPAVEQKRYIPIEG